MRWIIGAVAGVVMTLAPAVAGFAYSEYVSDATLTGANEAPPNGSPATGTVKISRFSYAPDMWRFQVSFSGLTSEATAAHIHCCTALPDTGTAGVATPLPFFPGFPVGMMDGTYDHIFDMTNPTSYNPAFLTANGGSVAAAELALSTGMELGTAYFNIHTVEFPTGEIRGFFRTSVLDFIDMPEPATLAFFAAGLLGALRLRRRSA